MKYYLAIDIGASSGRHIVAHVENGRLVTEEIYRFPNGAKEVDGRLYWDVDGIFDNILKGLERAGELNKIPAYIGIDTWAVDYALIGEDGKRLYPVFCYRDARGERAAAKVHRKIPFNSLYEKTGIQYQPFNTVYQLYDDKTEGRLKKAYKMLMLPDYFNYLLTGVIKQEYTNATSTGLVNATKNDWDEDILKTLGIDKSIFSKPTMPGCVVGGLKDEIAKKVGYKSIIALPATHDTASAVDALDIGEGVPYLSSGTWSLLGVKIKKALTDEKSAATNWSNEGGPAYFRYQKNIMGLWLVQRLRSELCPEKSFDEIVKEVEKCPYNRVIDVNDKIFFSPPSMKKAFDDATKGGGERPISEADYFKAAYLGLAHCYKRTLDELYDNTGIRAEKLYIAGGGAKNDYLNGLTAEVCGVEVIALPVEATAIGNLKRIISADGVDVSALVY